MIDNGVQKKSGWDISESIGLTAKKPFNSTVSKDRMSLAFPPVVVEDPRFCTRRREISSDEMVAPRTEIDMAHNTVLDPVCGGCGIVWLFPRADVAHLDYESDREVENNLMLNSITIAKFLSIKGLPTSFRLTSQIGQLLICRIACARDPSAKDSRTHHEPTLNLRLFAVLRAVKINSYVQGIHQLRYSALAITLIPKSHEPNEHVHLNLSLLVHLWCATSLLCARPYGLFQMVDIWVSYTS
ncbi:hypothetical protein B0H14DRAFT_2584801 [Mycena olivaceomarginata]|nr:hypothetical protein B0H14DRAFT_2584801 [Mycena olivaceomarginata]